MERSVNVIAQSQFLSSDMQEEFIPQPVPTFRFKLLSAGTFIEQSTLCCDTDEFTVGDILNSKATTQRYVVLDIDPQNTLVTIEYVKNAYLKIAFLLLLLAGCWFPVSYILEKFFS